MWFIIRFCKLIFYVYAKNEKIENELAELNFERYNGVSIMKYANELKRTCDSNAHICDSEFLKKNVGILAETL